MAGGLSMRQVIYLRLWNQQSIISKNYFYVFTYVLLKRRSQ